MTSGRAAFRWLWAGQTASVLGTAVSGLAIPTIAIVSLGAAPFAVGLLATVQFASFPLLGLVAGVWVDRWSRRATMLVADVIRMLAPATIPLAAFAHVLGFAQLVAVAACVGAASVFFEVAYQSLVPSLVEPERLERANARLEFSNSFAQIAGNGLAGALISLAGAPVAVIVDATLRTVVWGTMPLGTLLGGALAGAIGIVPTLVAGAAVAACAIPWLLTAPIRALRAEPAPAQSAP
ncbi:MAG TPA: MFS transporter [Candidatus Elarobacter sp.]